MKLAIATSGGDCPGLNAVIVGAVGAATRLGHTIVGIRNGLSGLRTDNGVVPLTPQMVRGAERAGGTLLGTANDGRPFGDGNELLPEILERLEQEEIDGLILAGGDGSIQMALTLANHGARVVTVPKTIDRDVPHTWTTFGFDTAVNIAVEAIDRLHSTAASHDRIMVVEVMGRDAGWIALYAGMAGGACAILVPEIPFSIERVAEHIRTREQEGERYHIVVCAEGARPRDGRAFRSERTGRYGGVGEHVAAQLEKLTRKESRSLNLGHLLRGGPPTMSDRILGLRLGSAAVRALARGNTGIMISFRPPKLVAVPLQKVAGKIRTIGTRTGELATARDLGICFGD